MFPIQKLDIYMINHIFGFLHKEAYLCKNNLVIRFAKKQIDNLFNDISSLYKNTKINKHYISNVRYSSFWSRNVLDITRIDNLFYKKDNFVRHTEQTTSFGKQKYTKICTGIHKIIMTTDDNIDVYINISSTFI
jgi:hypothetical protein